MARDVSATRSRLYPRPKKSWVALLVGGDRADRLRRGLLVALLLAGGVVFATIDRADPRLLWLLPPLFAVWANTHGGFVAGLGVLALYLGCRAAERLCAQGRRGLAPAALYGGVALASALATLLNPYGLDLLTWLVRDLGPPRPEIFEWRALSPSDAVFPIFVIVLGLTATAWLARRQWRDPARTVLLAATAWQCVAHVRHLPFFAIAAGFWLPAQLQPLVDRMRHATERSTASGPRRAGWAAWGVWAVDLGLAALLAVHVRGPLVERSVYPVNAFRYMAKRRLTGRVVVHFDWAQYAIAAFGDDAPVAFDGRLRTCYPQEVADAYFDFLVGDRLIPRWRSEQSPPVDATRVLRLGDPDLAVVARHFTHSVEVMEARADWVLLYQDAVAQLWGRRDRYGDAASPDYLPPAQRWITEVRQVGSVPWPALPPRRVVASAARPAVAAAHAAGAG